MIRLLLVIAMVLFTATLAAADDSVRLMSFNIRFGTAADGDDAWPERKELVAETIRQFDPDVLGLQEALDFQLQELREMLPGYRSVGVGRDDGRAKGEYTVIFYRADRLELDDSGTFWFADTPEQPGSVTWEASLPRICTWALFSDRRTKRPFAVYNMHWDHQSQVSREKSGAMLLQRIADQGHDDLPLVVMGDFNADEENRAFTQLLSSPIGLRDSFRLLHPDATGAGTFHGFRGDAGERKIDAVLVSPHWKVDEAAIDRTQREGRFPSDHYPVTAVVRLDSSPE